MEPQNPDILNMPMLPLRGLVLFPRMILHFDVGRPRSVRAVEHAIRNNTPIFLVAQKDIRNADPAVSELYASGTIANVRQTVRLGSVMRVLVEGTDRARLSRVWQEEPYVRVEVEKLHIPAVEPSNTKIISAPVRVALMSAQARTVCVITDSMCRVRNSPPKRPRASRLLPTFSSTRRSSG